ncbi:MAG TPA: hypothetical protein VKA37_11060 [Halobacteriales archaeon]|nr:hypothetical protein [Halobacteriales archaeon]
MRPKSFAVLAVGFLLVAALAPVAAADGTLSVAANQPAPGEPTTVTVTHNGTAADNASVDVNEVDGNYSGNGSYETDVNGTVTLPEPSENVTVEINASYEEHQASISSELLVAEAGSHEEPENFGQEVSAFVHSLLHGDEEQRRIGRLIAEYVVANNPGNAPDHAGPPDDRGPPSTVGSADSDQTGGNATVSSASDNPGGGNGNGPPDDPGKGNGKAKGR